MKSNFFWTKTAAEYLGGAAAGAEPPDAVEVVSAVVEEVVPLVVAAPEAVPRACAGLNVTTSVAGGTVEEVEPLAIAVLGPTIGGGLAVVPVARAALELLVFTIPKVVSAFRAVLAASEPDVGAETAPAVGTGVQGAEDAVKWE